VNTRIGSDWVGSGQMDPCPTLRRALPSADKNIRLEPQFEPHMGKAVS